MPMVWECNSLRRHSIPTFQPWWLLVSTSQPGFLPFLPPCLTWGRKDHNQISSNTNEKRMNDLDVLQKPRLFSSSRFCFLFRLWLLLSLLFVVFDSLLLSRGLLCLWTCFSTKKCFFEFLQLCLFLLCKPKKPLEPQKWGNAWS